jgi:hypothetical protein
MPGSLAKVGWVHWPANVPVVAVFAVLSVAVYWVTGRRLLNATDVEPAKASS